MKGIESEGEFFWFLLASAEIHSDAAERKKVQSQPYYIGCSGHDITLCLGLLTIIWLGCVSHKEKPLSGILLIVGENMLTTYSGGFLTVGFCCYF